MRSFDFMINFNPDRVKQFTFVKKLGTVKIYEISETETDYQISQIKTILPSSQVVIRRILNESIGVGKNPWCFVQNMLRDQWNFNNLSIDALFWWKIYSTEPKMIAFRLNKPYGFRAVANYDKKIFKSLNGYSEEDFQLHKEEFYKEALPWMDRFNNQFYDIDQNGNFIEC